MIISWEQNLSLKNVRTPVIFVANFLLFGSLFISVQSISAFCRQYNWVIWDWGAFRNTNTKFFGIEKLDLSRNKNIGCGLGTKTHFWRPSLIHKVSISKKILTGNRKEKQHQIHIYESKIIERRPYEDSSVFVEMLFLERGSWERVSVFLEPVPKAMAYHGFSFQTSLQFVWDNHSGVL